MNISPENLAKYKAELARATTEQDRDQVYRSMWLMHNRGTSVNSKSLDTKTLQAWAEQTYGA